MRYTLLEDVIRDDLVLNILLFEPLKAIIEIHLI